MPTREEILELLREIPDPEMPISIVDLGIVERVEIEQPADSESKDVVIHVDVLPTFVGCPALPMIQDDIEKKLSSLAGVGQVDVQFVYEPAWSVDRISEEGRQSLREHGVTVPEAGAMCGSGATASAANQVVQLRTSAVPCPFCGSKSTYLDSPFGPTRCRMIYYCEACRNSFEHMKRVQ